MVPPVYLSNGFGEWKGKKLRSAKLRVLTLFPMQLEDHNMIKQHPHIVHQLQGFFQ